jgi:hypothetical protein
MDTQPRSCSTCGPWWRLPLLLAVVLGAILLLRNGGVREVEPEAEQGLAPAPAGESAEQVSLAIDFGDGQREQYFGIAWREGMYVRDLMLEAGRPDLQLDVQGSGASAFLVAINGVANEGAEGKNWTYKVNGTRADRSFAVYELEPGDRVLWTFAAQQ